MYKSKTSQLLLVKFPIFFPLFYGLILFFFPSYEKELILITILILAETHFGATWPFFLNKVNYPYLKEKKIELIFIPILGQMLHFYIDSQVWKFSEKHNRENVLEHLKKIISLQ